MTEILRYLWRRKVRTALTMLSVIVGIFAVTAVGGIAEQLNESIRHVEQDALSRIFVWSTDYLNPISDDTVRSLRRVDGVAGLVVTRQDSLEKPGEGAVQISINPDIFSGVMSDIPGLEYEPPMSGMQLWAGRLPERGNRTEALVTWELAQKKNLAVGDILMIRERPFTVVGIWESYSDVGRAATIDYYAAEDLIANEYNTPLVQVVPLADIDTEELVLRINELVPEVNAQSPQQAVRDARQQVLIFSLVVGASGVISLLIGTFTIVNTMVVSVQERRREIGLKKALGAENAHVLKDVITEAVLIAGVGGLLGLLGGTLAGEMANRLLVSSLGTTIFRLTPRLAIGVVFFSVLMGVIAGAYPAWRAARLNPVVALRGGSAANYAGRGLKRLIYLVRRNGRAIFTVVGIAIGVFSLVLLGCLSEALLSYSNDVTEMTKDMLLIFPGRADAPLGSATLRDLEKLADVAEVVEASNGSLPIHFDGDYDSDAISTSIWAYEAQTDYLGIAMPVRNSLQGRALRPESLDEVLVGASLAETQNLNLGDVILIDEHPFKIVGIWERIAFDLTGHNSAAFISLEAFNQINNTPGAIGFLSLRARSAAVLADLQSTIETELPDLEVSSITETFGQITKIFGSLMAVMGAIFSIAIFVGGVSVINTMVISVNEQIPEIGLKKAVGAENVDILSEVLLDAGKLGVLGGIVGIALAIPLMLIINALLNQSLGLTPLNLTPRLAIGASVFSTLLGIVAGFFPARRAAKFDPVVALHAD